MIEIRARRPSGYRRPIGKSEDRFGKGCRQVDLGARVDAVIVYNTGKARPVGVFPVPTAGPPQRVHDRDRGAVAACNSRNKLLRLAQPGMFGSRAGRYSSAPVGMQLRLGVSGCRIDPFASRPDDLGWFS
jgi:hypothetical protein